VSNEPIPAAPGMPLEIPSTPDDRMMAMLCHFGGIIGGFLLPLIIWLVKKDQSKFIDDQGKEALNFQITMFIAIMISVVSIIAFIGLLLLPAVLIVNMVFSILAGIAANKGTVYRYPFTLRLIS
jgi:uncharacterized Tic20 family protein